MLNNCGWVDESEVVMKKFMKLLRNPRSYKSDESGQSLVEFAVSAVIIILLLVAIVDFGRILFTYVAMRDAAQEGAVYGSICPRDVNVIEFRARTASTTPIDLSDTSVTTFECKYLGPDDNSSADDANCGTIVPTPGTSIQVTIRYPNFTFAMPFLGGFLGYQSVNLTATVKDTILRTDVCN